MLLISLAALLAAPEVLTVDAYGHGGHRTIQAAVDAAADGDTIVVHSLDDHLDFHDGFTIDGKSLTLHSQGAPAPDGAASGRRGILVGPVEVRHLAPGQTVTLRGFHLGSSEFVDSPFAPAPGLTCTSTTGSIRVESCTIRPHAGGPVPHAALIAQAVSDLSIVDSILAGGQRELGDSGGALLARDSRVSLYGTEVLGGDGRDKFEYQAEVFGGHGGTALRFEGRSFGWIAGCSIVGGDGGLASNFNVLPLSSTGGNGGDGLWVDGPSYCAVLESTVSPGSGGAASNGITNEEGQDGVEVVGHVEQVPGGLRRIALPAAARSGESVQVSITGLPGERVTLLQSEEGWLRFLGPLFGILQVRTPYAAPPVEVGVIPPSGTLLVNVALPTVGSGGTARRTFQALCSTAPTRFRLSSPRTVTVFANDVNVILPGDRVYIDSRAASGTLARDWNSARSDLGAALRAAPYEPDQPVEFWLKAGRYAPQFDASGAHESLRLRSNVELLGGFSGTEIDRTDRDPLAHPTYFDADVAMDDQGGGGVSDNVGTLIRSGFGPTRRANVYDVVLDGLGFYRSQGGPALQVSGRVTVNQCIFEANDSGTAPGAGLGGAIQFGMAVMPIRERCVLKVDRSIFRNNVGLRAGAIRTNFEREGYGLNLPEPRMFVRSCQFTGNEARATNGYSTSVTVYGEAISIYFNARSAPGFALNIENNTFFRNGQRQGARAVVGLGGYNGGGYPSSGARIVNNILWQNSAPPDQWNPLSGFGFNSPGIVSNCVSYPTTYVDDYYTDSFNEEPRFVNPAGADGVIGTADDDLRLQPGSTLIDRGAANLLSPAHQLDLAGAPRRRDDPAAPNVGTGGVPHVDVGALER